MKKALLVALSIILYFSSCNYHKVMFDLTLRANYIIALMEEYNKLNGHYPEKTEDILEVEDAKDALMYDSSKIPGKGYFIIYDGVDRYRFGHILVVGNYVTPNIIYFPKIKKKEINSYYFDD